MFARSFSLWILFLFLLQGMSSLASIPLAITPEHLALWTRTEFDSLNQLTKVTHEGQQKASFQYDPNGNVIHHESVIPAGLVGRYEGHEVSFGYDEMNRLTASTQTFSFVSFASFVVKNSFDSNGNRTNIVYPGGLSVGYSYDEDNRLSALSIFAPFASSREISFQYDTASRLSGISYPNGIQSSFGYDAESRIIDYNHGDFISRSIQRDPRGYKISEDVLAGLIPAFTNETRETLTHNPADQLQRIADTKNPDRGCSYDANGCLTSVVTESSSQTLSYDYDQRLVQISNSTCTVEYLHDASGARVGRIEKNGSTTNTTLYVLDRQASLKMPLCELDENGDIIRWYIWSSHGLLAHIDADGTTRYYHGDEQASTLALTDEAGTVTDEFAYGPYGSELSHQGITQTPFKWLGGIAVRDEGTGLYYMMNRTYSSVQRRFISTDPAGIDGGLNLYAYGNLNPMHFVDPFGLCADSGGGTIRNLDVYDSMSAMASAGWNRGGFAGKLQGNFYSGMTAVLDTVGGRGVERSAGLSGSASGEGRTGDSIKHGAATAGLVALNAYSGGQSASALGKLGTYAKNPILYEIGAKTLPTSTYDELGLAGMSQIQKGSVITEKLYQGSKLRAFLKPVPTTAYANTVWTGLTPGGAYVLGATTAGVNKRADGQPK